MKSSIIILIVALVTINALPFPGSPPLPLPESETSDVPSNIPGLPGILFGENQIESEDSEESEDNSKSNDNSKVNLNIHMNGGSGNRAGEGSSNSVVVNFNFNENKQQREVTENKEDVVGGVLTDALRSAGSQFTFEPYIFGGIGIPVTESYDDHSMSLE